MVNQDVLKQACLTAVSSAYLSCNNHSMDNSFIGVEPIEVCHGLSFARAYPVGFCFNVPYSHYSTQHIAMVIEDNDEIKWVHFPLIAYKRLLYKLFGADKAKTIEDCVGKGMDYKEAC